MPSVACANYVSRIKCIAIEDPKLLVGHHYTRYLGDLSGGQILKGIAEKAMGLKDEGLYFYDFDKIENAKKYKDGYRAILNGLDVDQHQVDAIIVEANYAFRLNMYMFDEIQGNSWHGFFKMIFGFIRSNINNWERGQ